jgi:hypothetical protein
MGLKDIYIYFNEEREVLTLQGKGKAAAVDFDKRRRF